MKKYIDVDLLKEILNGFLNTTPSDTLDYDCGYDDCVTAVQDTISDMPAADVEEVKHGEWIDKLVECNGVAEIKSVCSLCGNPNKRYKPPYCPHCGAKMDNSCGEHVIRIDVKI